MTAHDPHFKVGTINIEGTECETTDFVWHTLMNTVRWWCRNKEWVKLDIAPDDNRSMLFPKKKLRVCRCVSPGLGQKTSGGFGAALGALEAAGAWSSTFARPTARTRAVLGPESHESP